ncbi:MAG: hypothetical protein ABSA18_11620 [Dehalococcoidia bacterium]|jgi:hypothetical protein
MDNNLYAEKLRWFKLNEKPESVLLIADNPELIKITIAWTNLEVRTATKLTELVGESENEIWEWLWKNTMFSLTELRLKADVPYLESVLEGKMRPLIGNRILYPDGTENSFVQRFLRERVLKLFETRLKKSTKE